MNSREAWRRCQVGPWIAIFWTTTWPGAVGAVLLGRPRAVEAHARRAHGHGQMEWACVGTDEHPREADQGGQFAERRGRGKPGMTCGTGDDRLGQLALVGAGPNHERRQLPLAPEVLSHDGKPLRRPELRGPARPGVDDRKGGIEPDFVEHSGGCLAFRLRLGDAELDRRPHNPKGSINSSERSTVCFVWVWIGSV